MLIKQICGGTEIWHFSEVHSCRYLEVSGGPDAGTSRSLDRHVDRDIGVTENLPDSQIEENNEKKMQMFVTYVLI